MVIYFNGENKISRADVIDGCAYISTKRARAREIHKSPRGKVFRASVRENLRNLSHGDFNVTKLAALANGEPGVPLSRRSGSTCFEVFDSFLLIFDAALICCAIDAAISATMFLVDFVGIGGSQMSTWVLGFQRGKGGQGRGVILFLGST